MSLGKRERGTRLVKEGHNDSYHNREKSSGPVKCTGCGAVFNAGRWTWNKPAAVRETTLCPACRRGKDHCPAGSLEIKGGFFVKHQLEIVHCIRNVEHLEESRHPLERIIAIVSMPKHTLVETTGVHIVRRIGEALLRSYNGDLSFHYSPGEKTVQGFWNREE